MAGELSLLHLCTRYQRGGSEQRLRDVVEAIPGSHHIIVGRDSDRDLARSDLPESIIEVWPELVRDPNPHLDARLLRRLISRLRIAGVDLLLTHQSKAGLVGRIAGRRTGTPVVHSVSMASTGPGYGAITGRVFQLAERMVATSGAGYAIVGQDLLERVVDNGVPRERCKVVRSGAHLPIDASTRQGYRALLPARLHELADRPWVAAVGSLEPRKRADQLPDLFARMRDSHGTADPVLLVAGEGPLGPALARQIESHGLAGDVHLLGHVPWAAELIAASDLVVLMSGAEGLPQVLVQAAAANTPFACYDVDGANELRALGARGAVVAQGDISALAAAAVELLGQRVESARPLIDLSSWSPQEIHAGYRDVVAGVLGHHLVS